MTIIKDVREKKGWEWPNMVRKALPTGDYTLEGLEDVLAIERKGSVSEYVDCLLGTRKDAFHRELERMEGFAHPFLILDFPIGQLFTFPALMHLPSHVQSLYPFNAEASSICPPRY